MGWTRFLSIAFRYRNALSDPLLDVAPAVANMLADAETRRSFALVPPRVQGLDRDIEIHGEFPDREQLVVLIHGSILELHPWRRIVFRLAARPIWTNH